MRIRILFILYLQVVRDILIKNQKLVLFAPNRRNGLVQVLEVHQSPRCVGWCRWAIAEGESPWELDHWIDSRAL